MRRFRSVSICSGGGAARRDELEPEEGREDEAPAEAETAAAGEEAEVDGEEEDEEEEELDEMDCDGWMGLSVSTAVRYTSPFS